MSQNFNDSPKEPSLPVYHEQPALCICGSLCFSTEQDLMALQNKRHHSHCRLYKTEKHPRLFYYEQAENCWAPAPEKIENIVDLSCFFGDDDKIEITFRRCDMTDEEFYNLPED